MKLYDFPFSPNCRKVRAVADELGIDLDDEHVDLLKGGSRDAAHLKINPNGKVPVLVDGDFVLWESNAIIGYLASKNGSTLVPTAPRERADVDRWLHWQLAHLAPAISKVAFERVVKKLTGQGAPDQAAIDAGTADFARLTAVLEESLGRKEYVAGRMSIADFALASHYSLATSCGLDMKPYPNANAWLDRMLSRASFQRALADAKAHA